MGGRYPQAIEQFRQLDERLSDRQIGISINIRYFRVLGWIALAKENFDEAREQLEKSIGLFTQYHVDEELAWCHAALIGVAFHQGKMDEAHQILQEALGTAVKIKGFIPLLFILPFACLFLAEEDSELAAFVYIQIQHSPFLSKAKFFEDSVYKYLPDQIKHLEKIGDPIPDEVDLNQRLWTTASRILSFWGVSDHNH
jgi:tetratricopeptide (TPR) repeat protein